MTTIGFSGVYAGGEYQGPMSVRLTASDNASGLAATYYILGNGAKTTYSGQFKVTSAGNHSVQFWSLDVAGNLEKTNEDDFTNN